jgi:acetoin utilization deacetylase AcuC-like enzyme
MWHDTPGWGIGYGLEIERFIQPDVGSGPIGPESKRRIRNLLEVSGLLEQLTPIAPRLATREEVRRLHSEEYVSRVEEGSAALGGWAGPGTVFRTGGYESALLSAGGVLAAVDAVLDGEVGNAYALVRPPGHHASRDQGTGLCIFGNVAIAASHLLETRGLERVAVVDWDVHHGNGTQELFYEDPRVLTISLHQAGVRLGASLGTVDERGAGSGAGCNLNVPLPAGSGRGAYLAAFERAVVPALRRFEPQFLLVASGLDAAYTDPTGRMQLFPEAYRDLTQVLLDVAGELCNGRLVAAHEGGYSEFLAPFCGLAIIATLRGIRSEVEDLMKGMPFGGEQDQLLQPHQEAAIAAVVEALG